MGVACLDWPEVWRSLTSKRTRFQSFLFSAVYCKPKKMYLTDIHEPTLANLKYNAIKNNFKEAENVSSDEKSVFRMDSDETVVEVLNVNWKDPSSYPSDSIDVILGSDLVYDSAILRMLVPALETMLSKGMSTSNLMTITKFRKRWDIFILCAR